MEYNPEQEKLQADLVMGNSGAAAAVLPADQSSKPERAQRQRAAPSRVEQKIDALMTVLALIGVLAIAGVIWWFGANFTLNFLATLWSPIARLGWMAWVVPVFVTMIELKYWRHMTTFSVAGAVVFFVLVFDIGSSFSGFTQWAAGRTLPLFTGIPFPESGAKLWLLGISLGVIFAFAPERMVRWALGEFAKMRK